MHLTRKQTILIVTLSAVAVLLLVGLRIVYKRYFVFRNTYCDKFCFQIVIYLNTIVFRLQRYK